MIHEFTTRQVQAETVFHGMPLIAFGGHAAVYDVCGLAVKVSTPTTGRLTLKVNHPLKPEDQLRQFSFMERLQARIGNQHSVIVPEQYLALNGPTGNLRIEQLMHGWMELSRWRARQDDGLNLNNFEQLHRPAKQRIRDAVGSASIMAMMDLGPGIRCNNILVPEGTADPATDTLCIIDQPAYGWAGKFATTLV